MRSTTLNPPRSGGRSVDVRDLTGNARIARLTRLTRDLEQCRTPAQTLRVVRRALTDAHGFVGSVLLSTRGLALGGYRVVDVEVDEAAAGDGAGEGGEGDGEVRAWGAPSVVQSDGPMATIVSRPATQLVRNLDWSEDPYFHDVLDGYSSAAAIPLSGERLPIDWAVLLRRPPAAEFTESDVEVAVERAALVAALLENQALAGELGRANERLDEEARQVGELQRALLPDALPRVAGLEIAASYEPSARAGGDLYDFFPLDDGDEAPSVADRGGATAPTRWCMFVGDAAGHGLATAVVMAIVQTVLRENAASAQSAASLLARVNRRLCGRRIVGFVTAFIGIYGPQARRLTYANAGHPNPLVRRAADGAVAALDAVGNYPIGIDGDAAFDEGIVQLAPGDTLLLYTDGIVEARDPDGNELGNVALALEMCHGPDGPDELVADVRRAVTTFERGRAAVDDQTVVATRVL